MALLILPKQFDGIQIVLIINGKWYKSFMPVNVTMVVIPVIYQCLATEKET